MSNKNQRRRHTPNAIPTSERTTPPSRPSPPLDAEERARLVEHDADEVMGHLKQFVDGGVAAQRAVDEALSVGGKVMPETRRHAIELSMALRALVDGLPHLDNTGARCRVDLDDHDACRTCNGIGGAIRAWKEHGHG